MRQILKNPFLFPNSMLDVSRFQALVRRRFTVCGGPALGLVFCLLCLPCLTGSVFAQNTAEEPALAPAAAVGEDTVGVEVLEPLAEEEAASPRPDQVAAQAAFEFTQAKLLADAGSMVQALEAYQRAIDLDGSDPYVRIEAAKFYVYLAQVSRMQERQMRHLKAAAEQVEEARKLAPDNSDILRNFAEVHLRLVEQNHLPSLSLATDAFEKLRGTDNDLQTLMSLGQLYLWQRKNDLAAEALKEAAALRPNNHMTRVMLVEAMLGSGDREGAEEALRELIRIDPQSTENRIRLVELMSERNDHSGAVELLMSAPEEVADNVRLRQALARELHFNGRNRDALEVLEGLQKEKGGEEGMRRLEVAIFSSLARYEEAIIVFEPILRSAADPERKAQDALLMSRLLERVGRVAEAADELQRVLGGDSLSNSQRLQVQLALVGVLERNDRTAMALDLMNQQLDEAEGREIAAFGRVLSDILTRNKRLSEAQEVLTKTLAKLEKVGETGESVERVRLQRLILWGEQENWQKVIAEAPALEKSDVDDIRLRATFSHVDALAASERLEEALDLLNSEDSNPQAQQFLSKKLQMLFDSGREQEAVEKLRGLSAKEDAETLFFAAQIYQSQERYENSIPLLRKILQQNAKSRQALFLLGAALERSGDHDDAVETFQRLLELFPNHSPALNYLGYMWAERKENLEEALELIQRAVAIDPDNGAYVDSLGWAHFQLGNLQQARVHLEWAVRLVPEDPTIREHLGDLYARLKELESARASYQQALDLGGEDTEDLRRKLESLEENGDEKGRL